MCFSIKLKTIYRSKAKHVSIKSSLYKFDLYRGYKYLVRVHNFTTAQRLCATAKYQAGFEYKLHFAKNLIQLKSRSIQINVLSDRSFGPPMCEEQISNLARLHSKEFMFTQHRRLLKRYIHLNSQTTFVQSKRHTRMIIF